MTARQQWAVVLAVVAALGLGLAAAVHFLGDEIFPVTVGSAAPAFSGVPVTEGGQPVSGPARTLDTYRGQVVVLNVWATWCEPCRIEMPAIQALYRELGPRGLHVVALSIDDPGAQENIRAFVRQYGLTFEVLHDAPAAVKVAYQTTGVPETFVIGRDGVIRKKVIGAVDWNSDANRRLLDRLLAEPGP